MVGIHLCFSWYTPYMSKSIQMLTFDESYCHSSGVYDAKIYEIKKDTKEVKFNFIDINKFWLQYFVNNQYLPEAVKKAVLEHEELFTVQLVQESCAYIYTEDMKDEIILNAKT